MRLILAIIVTYILAKTAIMLFDIYFYRKEITILFILDKNVDKNFYKKDDPFTHILLYEEYSISFFSLNRKSINQNNIYFHKNNEILAIPSLARLSILGFFFKRKIQKLNNNIIKNIKKYENLLEV